MVNIGSRIRQARLVARMTLDDVVRKLSDLGNPLSKQTLSHYERNKRTPSAKIIIFLAKALGIRPAYFLEEPEVRIEWLAYRSHKSLRERRKEVIEAHAQNAAEKIIYLIDTIMPDYIPGFPDPYVVESCEDAEHAAESLRDHWSLGRDHIENLAQIVENKGGIVDFLPSEDITFGGLSGWVNSRFPLIVLNSEVPVDRQRFSLAHELGHLVMDCSGVDEKSEERIAHRFAGALLAPAESVKRDFVSKRGRLTWMEIGMMKQRYGLSMQASIFRLKDLGIIEKSTFENYFKQFNWRGWRKREPYDYEGKEIPARLKQMVLFAYSEGIITQEKAEELYPGCTERSDEMWEPKILPQSSPKALMKLPPDERRTLLEETASLAKKEYEENKELTDFEAFGEDDLYD